MTAETTAAPVGRIELSSMTASIVTAYLAGNACEACDLPDLLKVVFSTLADVVAVSPAAAPPIPACDPKKSVTQEYIVCLEDGRKFKSMKRHLSTSFGMTPDEYRARWGLPRTYPMVAPGYAKRRSDMAKDIGLGRIRGDVELKRAA